MPIFQDEERTRGRLKYWHNEILKTGLFESLLKAKQSLGIGLALKDSCFWSPLGLTGAQISVICDRCSGVSH